MMDREALSSGFGLGRAAKIGLWLVVAVITLAIVACGMFVAYVAGRYAPPVPGGLDYQNLVIIVLTAVAVIFAGASIALTALGIGIGIMAIVGYQQGRRIIRDAAERAAGRRAEEAARQAAGPIARQVARDTAEPLARRIATEILKDRDPTLSDTEVNSIVEALAEEGGDDDVGSVGSAR